MVRDGALGEHITVGLTINFALVPGTKATLIAASLGTSAHRPDAPARAGDRVPSP
jgi:hypothetical protein